MVPHRPRLFQGAYTPRPPSLSIRICDARAAAEARTTRFLPQLPAHVTSVVFNTEDGVENSISPMGTDSPVPASAFNWRGTATVPVVDGASSPVDVGPIGSAGQGG
ncbi:hypothetical protein [Embleya sp. MST-111070]|uniref:hypothetical protein n=1 Tax=Embleya sp. MST-111070 TaxID=3398231 RepID=UPI003F732373